MTEREQNASRLARFEDSGVREEGLVRRGEDRVGRELGKGVDYHPSNLAVFGRPGDHPTAVENFKVDALDRFALATLIFVPFLINPCKVIS